MRLIDADYLAKLLREQKVKQTGKLTEGINKGLNTALSLARNPDACPTIDAEPVKHGEWEITEDDWHSLTLMKCSLCHEEWCFECEEETLQHYNFCPNCGAKMDGERKKYD